MEDKKLTKKELKELRKQEVKEEMAQKLKQDAQKKWFFIGAVAIGVLSLLGVIIYKAAQPEKPLPGQAVKELGREHIQDISGITYTSNPPTSGNHFNAWAKRGHYPRIISDGYLLHALEHGYIVISYNCGPLGKPQESFKYDPGDPLTRTPVDKDAVMAPFTPENMPKDTLPLPDSFTAAACKQLVSDVSTFLNDYQRIIIVGRPNLDVPIALTAWGRIQKFEKVDKEKMSEFIQAFHGNGPEQTVE